MVGLVWYCWFTLYIAVPCLSVIWVVIAEIQISIQRSVGYYYVVGLVHCSAVVLWGELDYRVWVLWGELVEEEVKTGGRMVAQ